MLKPPECSGCPLANIGNSFSIPEGDGSSGVAIIGEALEFEEAIEGLPFRPRAQAGSKLEESFRECSQDLYKPISRRQMKLWNVIACQPPGNELRGAPYEDKAIEHCKIHFDRAMQGWNPGANNRVLLALGNIPLKYLTGFSGVAEEKQSISHLTNFVFQSKYGLVVPSYHPSFIRRGNNHLTPILVECMKKALAVARGDYVHFPTYHGYVAPRYNIAPSLDDAWSFYYQCKDNIRLPISYDIETFDSAAADEDEREELGENSEIELFQFSLRPGEGIALPYPHETSWEKSRPSDEYAKVVDAILKLPNPKAGHNVYNFDNPRIQAKGHKIEGVIHDTMWMFKHWHPKLPRGLQAVSSLFNFPFPWKHLYSTNLEWYGCADVDSVQYILASLPKLMKARGVWEGYTRHVVKINPIMVGASERGIPVNETKREEVTDFFIGERKNLDNELQKSISDECRNIKPKRKNKETGEFDYGYIRQPRLVEEELNRYSILLEQAKRIARPNQRVKSFEDYIYTKHNLCYAEFKVLHSENGNGTVERRWCIVEPFKGSSVQLIRYLKWKQSELSKQIDQLVQHRQEAFGGRNPELTAQIDELRYLHSTYEVPKNLKTKKDTTSKKELEEMYLKNGDEILEKVVKIRSIDTNLNNYIPNWQPHKDGRVHTTFGYSAPTGQFDSRRPNILNCSKHTEYGQVFRGMIEAPQGYCFVEFDKKSFHVATMGYVADDAGYIRFSQIDPHSILGSYIDPSVIGGSISLSWSDEDIKRASREFKKRCKDHKGKDPNHNLDVRQELAKPTVLGNQLELGARKLQNQNRRFIHSIAEAEKLQAIISDLFPKVTIAKKNIKEEAFLKRFLINEFSRIQYFYDIYSFKWNKRDRKWDKKESEGAREPIAFRVQGCAFGMIDEELLEFERVGACEEHNFCNSIHDSIVFMPEVRKVDKLLAIGFDIMGRPCKQLVNEATGPEGLIVGVDASVGRNWKNYDKERNPEGMKEI